MTDERDIVDRIAEARAAYDALSPVDRAIHDDAQRRSFVRGQIGRGPGENPLVTEIVRLRAEVAALKSDVTDLVQAASDEATEVEKLRKELEVTKINADYEQDRCYEAEINLQSLRSEALEVVGPFAAAWREVELRRELFRHLTLAQVNSLAATEVRGNAFRNTAKFLAKHGERK